MGQLRRAAVALGMALLALPVVALTIFTLVALLPPLLFVTPAALLCAGLLLLSTRQLGDGRRSHVARVVPLRDRGCPPR